VLVFIIIREHKKIFVEQMCHNLVLHESEFHSATVMTIMLYFFKHTVKAFKSEEPPAINRTKELDELAVMRRQMVVDGQMNSQALKSQAILTEKVLARISLHHGDRMRCYDPNTSTYCQQGRICRLKAAIITRDIFCIYGDGWRASQDLIPFVPPCPPHDNRHNREQLPPLISFLQ
jgi:hypothetical protein